MPVGNGLVRFSINFSIKPSLTGSVCSRATRAVTISAFAGYLDSSDIGINYLLIHAGARRRQFLGRKLQ